MVYQKLGLQLGLALEQIQVLQYTMSSSNMREAKERYVFTNKQLGADDDRVLAERKRGANEDRMERILGKLKDMKQGRGGY